jgi:hypothetical protein
MQNIQSQYTEMVVLELRCGPAINAVTTLQRLNGSAIPVEKNRSHIPSSVVEVTTPLILLDQRGHLSKWKKHRLRVRSVPSLLDPFDEIGKLLDFEMAGAILMQQSTSLEYPMSAGRRGPAEYMPI